MKRRSMWSFQRHTHSPCDGKGTARRGCAAPAFGDQREHASLRAEPAQRTSEQRAAQVVGEHPALPHGDHAGFRSRLVDHRRDVAGGEHVRVRNRTQRSIDGNETAGVERQPRATQPRRRLDTGHPQHEIARARDGRCRTTRPPRRRVATMKSVSTSIPRARQHVREASLHALRVTIQKTCSCSDQTDPCRARTQRMMHGKRQFDTPRAATDHDHTHRRIARRLRAQPRHAAHASAE